MARAKRRARERWGGNDGAPRSNKIGETRRKNKVVCSMEAGSKSRRGNPGTAEARSKNYRIEKRLGDVAASLPQHFSRLRKLTPHATIHMAKNVEFMFLDLFLIYQR